MKHLTAEEREFFINSLRYFWEEKADIERCVSFDREVLQREFPEVLKAWDDYSTAKKTMSAVLREVQA